MRPRSYVLLLAALLPGTASAVAETSGAASSDPSPPGKMEESVSSPMPPQRNMDMQRRLLEELKKRLPTTPKQETLPMWVVNKSPTSVAIQRLVPTPSRTSVVEKKAEENEKQKKTAEKSSWTWETRVIPAAVGRSAIFRETQQIKPNEVMRLLVPKERTGKENARMRSIVQNDTTQINSSAAGALYSSTSESGDPVSEKEEGQGTILSQVLNATRPSPFPLATGTVLEPMTPPASTPGQEQQENLLQMFPFSRRNSSHFLLEILENGVARVMTLADMSRDVYMTHARLTSVHDFAPGNETSAKDEAGSDEVEQDKNEINPPYIYPSVNAGKKNSISHVMNILRKELQNSSKKNQTAAEAEKKCEDHDEEAQQAEDGEVQRRSSTSNKNSGSSPTGAGAGNGTGKSDDFISTENKTARPPPSSDFLSAWAKTARNGGANESNGESVIPSPAKKDEIIPVPALGKNTKSLISAVMKDEIPIPLWKQKLDEAEAANQDVPFALPSWMDAVPEHRLQEIVRHLGWRFSANRSTDFFNMEPGEGTSDGAPSDDLVVWNLSPVPFELGLKDGLLKYVVPAETNFTKASSMHRSERIGMLRFSASAAGYAGKEMVLRPLLSPRLAKELPFELKPLSFVYPGEMLLVVIFETAREFHTYDADDVKVHLADSALRGNCTMRASEALRRSNISVPVTRLDDQVTEVNTSSVINTTSTSGDEAADDATVENKTEEIQTASLPKNSSFVLAREASPRDLLWAEHRLFHSRKALARGEMQPNVFNRCLVKSATIPGRPNYIMPPRFSWRWWFQMWALNPYFHLCTQTPDSEFVRSFSLKLSGESAWFDRVYPEQSQPAAEDDLATLWAKSNMKQGELTVRVLREGPASVVVVEDLVSEAECQTLREHALIGGPLKPAVVMKGTGATRHTLDKSRRTLASQMCLGASMKEQSHCLMQGSGLSNSSTKENRNYTSYQSHPTDATFVSVRERLFEAARRLTGQGDLWSPGQEPLQYLNYPVGYEYKPHCDEEHCNDVTNKTDADNRPFQLAPIRRVTTALLYCDIPKRGGATVFVNDHLKFTPKKKGSVMFFKYNPDPGRNTRHAACPVLEGVKTTVTQWMRTGLQQEKDPTKFYQFRRDGHGKEGATSSQKQEL
ncbi:unnamed protein product [Amoebophrya sp. A120]|nr:unnamed protein product [Amoebophrya sp. A120]|eukprot:GSA120T00011702001.1